MADIFTK